MDNENIFFEGIEIGAVSLKWVRKRGGNEITAGSFRHEGNPREKLKEIFQTDENETQRKIVVTGQTARNLLDLPYKSETECLEKALAHHDLKPDILLALGGETFTIYTLRNGTVRNILSTSKCAAGTGEFIVQQLQRMNYTLSEGIEASRKGSRVDLATRCSVHCKSDATHKLNKGECTRDDIARSLIDDLAAKVCRMIEQTQWKSDRIFVAGGVSLNEPFIAALKDHLKKSEIMVSKESPWFEAFGAYLHARELPDDTAIALPDKRIKETEITYKKLAPLLESEDLLDYRVKPGTRREIAAGDPHVLGVDAGSTTTKAVLYNLEKGTVSASCYLRTHGNPVEATRQCLVELQKQIDGADVPIVQAAATGSGREMVSVFLDNCLCFNEILSHARAAAEEVRDVDTVFEIGGQDSKYISFIDGVPVDYAMNEGCSAGTGSFLEESISVDMNIPVDKISGRAEQSSRPISFGERCAAFINTDLRNALQQGAKQDDVIAGLVYSIVDNYISRIVGIRSVGRKILFQGGVALNRSVALAMAARSGRHIVVPPYPELMGCVGSALMLRDRLESNEIPKQKISLDEMTRRSMAVKDSFICRACENNCEIQRIEIKGKAYPFGGLCSRFENQRHQRDNAGSGRDFVARRNEMLFKEYGPGTVARPRGTIGIPMALSAYEYLPYYARIINELGYNVLLSEPNREGNKKTQGDICYPAEIAHGAVYDLLEKGVDYIFLPHLIETPIPEGHLHSYACINTASIPNLVETAFDGISDKLLRPHIGLSQHLLQTTEKEIVKTGKSLGVSRKQSLAAARKALVHYNDFRKSYSDAGMEYVREMSSQPTIIIAGRPYVYSSKEANFALPKKLISRGYNVLPMDMLPLSGESVYERNVWHFGQQILNAVSYAKKYKNFHICMISCFSCFPDASIYHMARNELAGQPFCYLEIDSHTAHAGFETRVGAFLDIIEERERLARSRTVTA